MIVKCIKCELEKELSSEELKEVGEFVLGRKLRAVHFLKYLSLDMRDICSDGRNHEWEFESNFDKEVHEISNKCNEWQKFRIEKLKDISEYDRIIKENEDKKKEAKYSIEESEDRIIQAKDSLKKITYIDDPDMWTVKE